MAQTAQLDLFASADAYRQLQAENAWLKAQLENAKTEFRKLREELQQCLQATQDALRLRRALEATNRECALWKSQAELSKMVADLVPHGAQPQLTAPRKADLTKLSVLCHPDKWSQGQPATELAHELTVQTGPTDCLHQCGIKPIVFDRCKSFNINTCPLTCCRPILPLRRLVAHRNELYRIQSI